MDFVIRLKTWCWHVYTSMTIFYLFQSVLNTLRLLQSLPGSKLKRLDFVKLLLKVCLNPLVLVRSQTYVVTLCCVIMHIVFISCLILISFLVFRSEWLEPGSGQWSGPGLLSRVSTVAREHWRESDLSTQYTSTDLSIHGDQQLSLARQSTELSLSWQLRVMLTCFVEIVILWDLRRRLWSGSR